MFAERPHNPMINAGAILVCSLLKTLVKPEMTLAEKFDYTMNYFKVRDVFYWAFNSALWVIFPLPHQLITYFLFL